MDRKLHDRRLRLEKRCRLWLYGGYGLLLAGMAVLISFPAMQVLAWSLVGLGIAGRIMYYLDHGNLRTLRRLEREQTHADALAVKDGLPR